MDLQQVVRILTHCRRAVLTTHVNPDGDGLGSELALAGALTAAGKSCAIVNHSAVPDHYRWMDPSGEILRFADAPDALDGADLIVVLDTSQPDRLRDMMNPVLGSPAAKLIIDHHLGAEPFGDLHIDENATSTGEMVYRVISAMPRASIDGRIATALYTAIMTDTGSFRYPRTSPETHRIAARLIECGADPVAIFSAVYETWTPGRMRLLGEALDSMRVSPDGRIAWMSTTIEMFRRTGTDPVATDTFTVYPMSVRDVLIGILFTELPDGVKISFRSKGEIPVNRLAMEFGGNGHLNASGARLHGVSLARLAPKVIAKAKSFLPRSSPKRARKR